MFFPMRFFGSGCGAVALWFIFAPQAASAEPACDSVKKDMGLRATVATAGGWANLRKAEGSLSYESQTMLNEASANLPLADPPQDFCPEGCKVSPRPLVVFRSIPNKFLSVYSDAAKCDAFFAQTKKQPLSFPNRVFASQTEFNAWFGDFSQGKGVDGAALYVQCDGDCSPQYICLIQPDADKIHVNAEVICGPARDKSDNQYQLSYGYRWSCVSK